MMMMMLLLLLSGNIHPNTGPELTQLKILDNLKCSSGIRLIDLKMHSLINKIDALHLWAKVTDSQSTFYMTIIF